MRVIELELPQFIVESKHIIGIVKEFASHKVLMIWVAGEQIELFAVVLHFVIQVNKVFQCHIALSLVFLNEPTMPYPQRCIYLIADKVET